MPFKIKALLAALAAAFLFAAGWCSRGERIVEVPHEVIKTQTQVQVQEKLVDHVVTHTITKVVKEPSGATTTTTTQDVTKTATDNETKSVAKESQRTESVGQGAPDYSLGLNWQPRLDPSVYMPTGVEFGRRLAGPVWGQVGYDWRSHSVTLGVRVEW